MQYPSPYTQRNALERLRDRMPQLHPHIALNLTLDLMLVNGEIDSEKYLQLASHMIQASQRPLFSAN